MKPEINKYCTQHRCENIKNPKCEAKLNTGKITVCPGLKREAKGGVDKEYQSKTFCSFTGCAKECDKKLNQIMDLNDNIRGALPKTIYTEKPNCYEYKDGKGENK